MWQIQDSSPGCLNLVPLFVHLYNWCTSILWACPGSIWLQVGLTDSLLLSLFSLLCCQLHFKPPTTQESYASLPTSREINIERGFPQYSKSSPGHRIVYELWWGMGWVNGLKIGSTLELNDEYKSNRSLEIWDLRGMDAEWASIWLFFLRTFNFEQTTPEWKEQLEGTLKR